MASPKTTKTREELSRARSETAKKKRRHEGGLRLKLGKGNCWTARDTLEVAASTYAIDTEADLLTPDGQPDDDAWERYLMEYANAHPVH